MQFEKKALFPNKNCTSRDIILFRKKILHKAQKNWQIQNIILSVAGSGVIEKIPLKSVIISESRLFRLT